MLKTTIVLFFCLVAVPAQAFTGRRQQRLKPCGLDFDEITVIAGSNDIGKSTVLNAIHAVPSRALGSRTSVFTEYEYHLEGGSSQLFRGGVTVEQLRAACVEAFGVERTPSLIRIALSPQVDTRLDLGRCNSAMSRIPFDPATKRPVRWTRAAGRMSGGPRRHRWVEVDEEVLRNRAQVLSSFASLT